MQEAPEEEIVCEPPTPEDLKKKTRSGAGYVQTGVSYAQVTKGEMSSSRSDKKKKSNGRCASRRKKRIKELKGKLKGCIKLKRSLRNTKAENLEAIHNLCFQQVGKTKTSSYMDTDALLIARCMTQIMDKCATKRGVQFLQQYYLNKGLKVFGDKGKTGVIKELDQMLKRKCFKPVSVKELTQQQISRAQDAMMLLSEKEITKEIKGRMVFRGDGTREWLSREDTASPTASQERIELTCAIDAHEGRDIMSTDIPNAFIQTYMPELEHGEEAIIMKITGSLVGILTDMVPEYSEFVVEENGKRVIYTEVLRAIYGMLQSSLLWYNQFRGDLEAKGFEFNPYDPCIANKMVNGKQQTIRFHVDDLLSSHMDPNAVCSTWQRRLSGVRDVLRVT